jgi:hypothetical protein
MRHAVLNDAGVVEMLFFDAPPPNAIKVPEFVEPGYRREGDQFLPPPPNIPVARRRAMDRINNLTAMLRSGTPGVPYGEKHSEALEVARMVDRSEDPNAMSPSEMLIAFPRLSASVGIEADTLADAAKLILKRYTETAIRDNAIEVIRLTAKSAIKSASSLADIEAASQKAISALEAMAGDGGSAH